MLHARIDSRASSFTGFRPSKVDKAQQSPALRNSSIGSKLKIRTRPDGNLSCTRSLRGVETEAAELAEEFPSARQKNIGSRKLSFSQELPAREQYNKNTCQNKTRIDIRAKQYAVARALFAR